MATRDVLVLNTTASRAETQQGSDTVVVRGDSTSALSVENSSGTPILSIDTISSSIDISGDITASGNFSSSLASSASFGRLEAVSLKGSAFNLTDTDLPNTISSSGQIASQISGAFRRGFEFTGTIGDFSPDNENMITASFGRIVATSLSGSASNLTNTDLDNTISGAAQIESNISGSFKHGFEFTGQITSSAGESSKLSVGRIVATTITGDVSNMTNVTKAGMISSSGQIASGISGSFQSGFEFDGSISGSATSTGSFGKFVATKAVGDISAMSSIFPVNTVSGSEQIASQISGAYQHGFEFVGKISGSMTSTGSFVQVIATKIIGDVSGMTGTAKPGFVSGSAQVATSISGSFGRGFTFGSHNQNMAGAPQYRNLYSPSDNRTIRGCLGAFSAGGALIVSKRNTAGIGTKAGALVVGGDTNPDPAAAYLDSTEEYNGSSFSEVNNLGTPRQLLMGAGTTEAGIVMGGQKFPSPGTIACTEVYNGTNWSEEADMTYCTKASGDAGDSSEAAIVFGGNYQTPASHYTNQGEEYNGTAWSEIANLNVSRSDLAGLGNSEAALAVAGEPTPGGHSPGNAYDAEEWDGSTWTSIQPTLNNPFLNNYVKGAGTVNDGHAFGGCYRCYIAPATNTRHYDGDSQHWDGTAWSHGGNLIAGRRFGGGDGTSGDNGFYVGGDIGNTAPYTSTCMEVYSRTFITASFGQLEANTMHGDISNLQNVNPSGIVSGSEQLASNISGSFNKGFTFEGTIQNTPYSFTEIAALNTARQSLGASGIKTAGLVFGGHAHPTQVASTETFDGSSWSEVNTLIAAGRGIGGSGTSTATVAFGGHPTRNQYTEEWNGTNWSEVNDMIRSDFACQAADIGFSSEAAIAAGSCTTGTLGDSNVLCNEEWNGTNWATANALIHNASQTGGGAGSANAGMTAGGYILPGYPGAHRCTQIWNGVNWSESEAALPPSNFRGFLYGWGGSQNDAILTGGCSYQGSFFNTSYCYNGISWAAGSAIGTLSGQNAAGVMQHKGAGTSVDNSFFAGGRAGGQGGNESVANAFCTDNGVATGSFKHIDAIRITGSVDAMTNISEPSGTISGSEQIASSISGSFNKGFEFSGEVRTIGAFSAGGSFPGHNNSTQFSAVYGTQNAALLGGGMGIYQPAMCDTYTYNGTSWSDTGANMIEGRGGYSGMGTQDAALAAGGNPYKDHLFRYLRSSTEEWNGSAWSENTNLPYQLTFLQNQNAGTQNAAFIAGGFTGTGSPTVGSGSEAFQQTSLAWDGLSYATVGCMANERGSGGVVGTINSSLAQGGNNSLGHSTCTEEWNGSAWSDAAASNFPTAFTQTVGTSNNAMHTVDASSPVKVGCTDFYNGVSWSVGPLAGLSTSGDPKQCIGAAGSTSAGLFMTYSNSCVEHFDEHTITSSIGRVDALNLSLESDTDLTVNNSFQLPIFSGSIFPVTSSAGEVWYNCTEEKLYFTYDVNTWTTTANTITARQYAAGAGSGAQDGLIAGGGFPSYLLKTEHWNGIAWSECNDHNNTGHRLGGGWSSCDMLLDVGYVNSNCTELWNGVNWTEEADSPGGIYSGTGMGTTNAFIKGGGFNYSHALLTAAYEWNGGSWSSTSALPTAIGAASSAGTQNSALFFGGRTPGTVPDNCSFAYNGTSWSTENALNQVKEGGGRAGTQNATLSFGGYSPTNLTATEEYNGTTWKSVNNMNTARRPFDTSQGTQGSAFTATGSPGNTSHSEIYTTTGIGCACIGGV